MESYVLEESLLCLFCHLQGTVQVAQEFLNPHLTGITLCLTFVRGCIASSLVQDLSVLDAGS